MAMAEQIEVTRRPRPPRRLVDFQVTKQHRRFLEFADAVRRHRYIGACYGAPGLGKTLSARTYAAADDYDQWASDRYSRGTVLPDSLIASRTLFYTPLVHITGRRLNLEVDLFAQSLSADINRALDPQCHPGIDLDVDIPYLTELVIIDLSRPSDYPEWAEVRWRVALSFPAFRCCELVVFGIITGLPRRR